MHCEGKVTQLNWCKLYNKFYNFTRKQSHNTNGWVGELCKGASMNPSWHWHDTKVQWRKQLTWFYDVEHCIFYQMISITLMKYENDILASLTASRHHLKHTKNLAFGNLNANFKSPVVSLCINVNFLSNGMHHIT